MNTDNKEGMIEWLNENVTAWSEGHTIKTQRPIPDPWVCDFPVGVAYFRVVNVDTCDVIYRSDCYIEESE